jgi:hypothetical protein
MSMYKLTKNQFNFLVSLMANRAEVDVPLEIRRKVYDLFYRVGYSREYHELDKNILNGIRKEFIDLKLKKTNWDNDLPF